MIPFDDVIMNNEVGRVLYVFQVLLREAIWNFFSSPAWAETKDSMGKIYEELMMDGFWRAWDEFKIQIDPEGETNAYRVSLCSLK